MDKRQALGKAMALCSRKEYSEAQIRSKLAFWGAEEEDVDEVIRQLIREKFIDDLRFATAFVRDKVRLNQWGRIKIRYMLSMEKVAGSTINAAIEQIDPSAYEEILLSLLQKKSRELRNETDPFARKQKLIRFAQGRGFEPDLAARLIKGI